MLSSGPVALKSVLQMERPVGVSTIPPQCFEKARFKRFPRHPAQLSFNLGRVDGISAIMPSTVWDVNDVVAMEEPVDARLKRIKRIKLTANSMNHIYIAFFVPATNVVSLAGPSVS